MKLEYPFQDPDYHGRRDGLWASDWGAYERRKRALPPMPPREYQAAIAAIIKELELFLARGVHGKR